MSEFKKMVGRGLSRKECSFCAALYDVHLARCPYCGSQNEAGDEERYQDKLEDMRQSLSQMDDDSEEAYADSARNTLRGVLKFLIIMGIIIAVISIIVFSFIFFMKMRDKAESRAQIEWQNETYPMLDDWYEKEDFDALYEFQRNLYAEGNKHEIWSWEHYQFLSAYYTYRSVLDYDMYYKSGYDLEYFDHKYAFSNSMVILYEVWDIKLNTARNINQRDYDYIMGYQIKVREILREDFGLSDEEIDALKERVTFDPPGVGVNYSKCDEVYKEISGNG